jgi:hypothetical protein
VSLTKHADPYTGAEFFTGDEAADLIPWFDALTGCPEVTDFRLLTCVNEGDLFCGYVQADPHSGVARRRCVACAEVTDLLDSGNRWSFPVTFECRGCQQSLVELAVGISADTERRAGWLALAARCVGCGRISGLTDCLIQGDTVEEVLVAV